MIRETVRAFVAAAALGWLINRGGVPVPVATWGSILLVGGAWLAIVIERGKQDEDRTRDLDQQTRDIIVRRSGGDAEKEDQHDPS